MTDQEYTLRRDMLRGAIKRAAEKTGLRYNQSTGEMVTGDGRVVVYSLITCNGASNETP